ncbi:glucose-methanol-choline oxidoreductase [Mycolicibacterium fortuitum]|nr:GMC family oxidoreductase [Mycolicibacterium fortuitum]OBB35773.1 glucose-methanol-choline oxidoreductase [Mycolicibacterium fortuitum]OBB45523.1 glucose-methanol-choline oxidoreductase [Mycolicibacterium fortuitum]OBB61054.1 glucose-methanol-choline oxidoreductase [Mycolicibacterium fortuitum]OBF71206.1 glucose-methanol-choline oxidoreductase [Mycolicibacterium fortuitum]
MNSLREVRRRNSSAWLIPNDGSRTNHRLRADMRRYHADDEVDVVIVGAGAGGATLGQRLARAGWTVVLIDAGPFWNPDTDWVSDERGSHGLYWTEPRQIGGANPVPLGSNNSGRGVGGSMVHYAGYTPRFHPSDFRTDSLDGVGADWPISYGDLRGYYEQIEAELPVAGQDWPWGDPHAYPHSPHPVSGNGLVALRGARRLGIEMRVGPVAIPNGRFGNRPHCIYRGFCIQGCKVNAKASPLITHIPDALAHGAEVRPDSHVTRVLVDDRQRQVTGVEYLHDGTLHRQRAQAVVVAGYAIETPRLLMLSATHGYPEGLGNEHDQLGRNVMVQGAPQVAGRFAGEIRMYKAPPPEASTEQFYETDPMKPYRRGFSVQNVSPLPITWSEHVAAQGHWGQTLREYMRDYIHWATLGALCELLPQPDNRVTLADEKDRHGLPVAHFSYSQCDNDKSLIAAATEVMSDMLRAAGAEEVIAIERYAHLVGGARMAARPEDGVIDDEHRVFGVDRLYVVDGSVLPTQGAANPALTIMALAARAADLMGGHAARS